MSHWEESLPAAAFRKHSRNNRPRFTKNCWWHKLSKMKPVKKEAESNKLFEDIRTYLKENPDTVKPDSGLFEFQVTGDVPTHWRVDLNKTPPVIRKSKVKDPDVTFIIKDEHLVKIAKGKLNVQMAVVQGRLKIKGDMNKAMVFGGLLTKLLKMNP